MRIALGCLVVFGLLPMLAGLVIVMESEGEGSGVRSVPDAHSYKVIRSTVFVSGAALSLGAAIGLYIKDRKQGEP